MESLHTRFLAFDTATVNIDIHSWARAAVSVTVIAVCLVALGTGLRQRPVVAGPSGGSIAANYIELRHRVEVRLPELRVTRDPAEILGRMSAINLAVRSDRRAAPGEVFTPIVAANVRALIAADLTRRSALDRARLMSEVPAMALWVDELYPAGEALATFPPLLLQVLPRLPDDLEYRFMGHDLIIWDARTNLIVDVLPDVTGVTDVTR